MTQDKVSPRQLVDKLREMRPEDEWADKFYAVVDALWAVVHGTDRPAMSAPPHVVAAGLITALFAENERLREAVLDAAVWLEAEADHPREDPRPAMRTQALLLRGVPISDAVRNLAE